MPGPETPISGEQPSQEENEAQSQGSDLEAYGQDRLEKLKELRKRERLDRAQEEEQLRGFAKLPAETEEQKILRQFSASEKQAILEELLGKEAYPEQVRLRLQQLDIIRTIFDETLSQIEHPKTRAGKGVAWGKRLGIHWAMEKLGVDTTSKAMERLAQEIHAFEEQDLPRITAEVMQGKVTLQELAAQHPLIQRATQKYRLDLSDPKTSEDLLKQQNNLVSYLRGAKNYELAAVTAEERLHKEFEEARRKVPGTVKLFSQAQEKVFAIVARHEATWRNPPAKMREQRAVPMTDRQVQEMKQRLVEEKYAAMLNAEAAKRINPSKLQGAKKQIWDQYNDMLDPKGEYFNVSDAHFDMILDEVAINAPLIIASGGVASGVRATLSAGARMVARRIAAEAAVTTAARVGAKEAIAAGARQAGKWAAGTLVEGATFEAVHSALIGELPHDLPEWSQRILWSSATLGLFHGVGKVSERAFSKTVLKDGRKITEATLLGSYVEKISNPAARETAKQLLVKGHIEAAGMLLMGAAQNGVYNGDLDDFYENFSDELLHAYITVGALKISHAGVETVTGRVFQPIEKKSKEVSNKIPLYKERDAEPIATLKDAIADSANETKLKQIIEDIRRRETKAETPAVTERSAETRSLEEDISTVPESQLKQKIKDINETHRGKYPKLKTHCWPSGTVSLHTVGRRSAEAS